MGTGVVLGQRSLPGQVEEEVLSQFGWYAVAARESYLRFVADGVDQGQRPELVGSGRVPSQPSVSATVRVEKKSSQILGDSAFVAGLGLETKFAGAAVPQRTLAELQVLVEQTLALDPGAIFSRARQGPGSDGRALFCYLAVREQGFSGSEVAAHLSVSPSTISRNAQRGARLTKKGDVVALVR